MIEWLALSNKWSSLI